MFKLNIIRLNDNVTTIIIYLTAPPSEFTKYYWNLVKLRKAVRNILHKNNSTMNLIISVDIAYLLNYIKENKLIVKSFKS